MRSSIFALAAALAVAAIPSAQPFAQLATVTPAPAQNPRFTSDPEAWRPVAHYDLALPTGEAEAYASIWQDRLDESNREPPPALLPGQKPNPAMSYAVGNRGASEWNFSINFQSKLVVLTVAQRLVQYCGGVGQVARDPKAAFGFLSFAFRDGVLQVHGLSIGVGGGEGETLSHHDRSEVQRVRADVSGAYAVDQGRRCGLRDGGAPRFGAANERGEIGDGRFAAIECGAGGIGESGSANAGLNAVEAKGLAILFPRVAGLKLDAALRNFENGELFRGALR